MCVCVRVCVRVCVCVCVCVIAHTDLYCKGTSTPSFPLSPSLPSPAEQGGHSRTAVRHSGEEPLCHCGGQADQRYVHMCVWGVWMRVWVCVWGVWVWVGVGGCVCLGCVDACVCVCVCVCESPTEIIAQPCPPLSQQGSRSVCREVCVGGVGGWVCEWGV